MAYDDAQGDIVLFGGQDATSLFGDTWMFKSGAWTEAAPSTSPSPRQGAAIAYDGATNQLLLFGGGSDSGFLGDTWTWDGSTWTQLHPAASPPARQRAEMVYDAAHHVIVLFGGYNGAYLNGTWTWNGVTWTKRHPTTVPPGRSTFALAYDPRYSNTLMFGGYNSTSHTLGGTWTWNGSNWIERHPSTSPSARRSGQQMAFDAATGQMILFGGEESTGAWRGDTWDWTGSTWQPLQPTSSPRGRTTGEMTYAPRRILLFGGRAAATVFGDTWGWTGNWKAIGPQVGTAQIPSLDPFTDTGISLEAGETISIVATGTASCCSGAMPVGPKGKAISGHVCRGALWVGPFTAPGVNCWSLIGRIGTSSAAFYVGRTFCVSTPTAGELFLGFNDNYYPDNTGGFTATIKTKSC